MHKRAHVSFIFSNPACYLFGGKLSRFRQGDTLASQTSGKKKQQLLLLFWWQRFRRRFNFLKFAHTQRISSKEDRQTFNMPLPNGAKAMVNW